MDKKSCVVFARSTSCWFLRQERAANRAFLPRAGNILAALQQPLDDVRVLIVGQDPYPTPGHPVGPQFSVAPDVRPLPPSLRNILQEYREDLGHEQPATATSRPGASRACCSSTAS